MLTHRLPLVAILLIAATFIFQSTQAQSSANVTWTISPPNNPQGYISGETIDICASVTDINFTDGSWVHGFQWEFPEGLDPNTFSINQQPDGCTAGTWNWYGAVTSNGSGLTYGPGFFFDAEQFSDLNPGNNYGENCPSSEYTMCMQISVIENCNPDTNTDLTPTLSIYGDGTTGAWVSNITDPITSQPSDMTLACCDANPGVSQEFVPICGSDPICLFDLISEGTSPDTDGIWIGPAGWSDNTECGIFNPTTDSPGTYAYTVIGTGGCFLTATVEMGYYNIDLGTVTHCQSTAIDLNEYLLSEGLPLTGDWYNPSGTLIPGGLIDPLSPGSQFGLFEYQVYDANACFTTANLELTLGPLVNPGIETTTEICSSQEIICPFDLLEGNPTPNGIWVLYGDFENFLDDFLAYDVCVDLSMYPDNEFFKFIYVLGVTPCEPSFTNLFVNFSDLPQLPTNNAASICQTDSLIDLNSLLEGTDYSDWEWSDPLNGNVISNPFDISVFPPGITLQLQYSAGMGLCDVSGFLIITILPNDADAGLNTTIEICETSPPFDMFNQLGGTPQPGGVWTNPLGMPMGGFFSSSIHQGGQYTYTVASTCDTDSATLTIGENQAPAIANLTETCDPTATEYTVSFTVTDGIPPLTLTGPTGITTVIPFIPFTFSSDPLSVAAIPSYVFTLSDSGACEDLLITGEPDCQCETANSAITTNNTTICEGTCTEFTLQLEGEAPFTAVYSDGISEMTLLGINDGHLVTVCPSVNTTYTLLSVSDANCTGSPIDQSVQINVSAMPNAGPDVTLNFCGDGSIVDLWTYTDPQADAGGVFVPTNFITLLPINSGVYTYNVLGFVCPSDNANYTVNIEEEVSISNLTQTCSPDGTEYTVSFDISGGTPPYTVSGVPMGSTTFTSLPISASNAYNFSISDSGFCLGITVSGLPDCQCETAYSTLTTANDSLCLYNCTYLDFELEGQGPFELVYTDGNMETVVESLDSIINIAVCPTVTTTYSLLSVEGMNCPPTPTNQSVTINVIDQPSAGPDVSLDFCPDYSLINLYDYLHPDANLQGYFPPLYDTLIAQVSNSGDYTYYIDDNICPSDSALYSINIFNPGNCTFEPGGGNQGISLNPGPDVNGGRPSGNSPFQADNHYIQREWDFTLFPNPLESSQSLQLLFNGMRASATLKVHDLTGRILWTERINTDESQQVPVLSNAPNFESGTYLISIATPDGHIKTKTLIITQ